MGLLFNINLSIILNLINCTVIFLYGNSNPLAVLVLHRNNSLVCNKPNKPPPIDSCFSLSMRILGLWTKDVAGLNFLILD